MSRQTYKGTAWPGAVRRIVLSGICMISILVTMSSVEAKIGSDARAHTGVLNGARVVSSVEQAIAAGPRTVLFRAGTYSGRFTQPAGSSWYASPGTHIKGELVSGEGSVLSGFEVSGGEVGVVCRGVCQNLDVHNNSQAGIHVGSDGVKLLNNYVHDNNLDLNPVTRGNPCWSSGGVHMVVGNNVVVEGNRLIHNGCDGVHADIGMRFGSFRNNVSENNTRFGVFIETSCDQVVEGNTIQNNGSAGLYIGNSPRVHVIDNTFGGNGVGIEWSDRPVRDYAPGAADCSPKNGSGGTQSGNALNGDNVINQP
ncbi:MAG: right-handed parallel beta-helix repeat-containing protein [Actinobacteria bacterium]|nr:right-handed parallel beta-helix repeat-containing protein [Actinomycetota bacterium]